MNIDYSSFNYIRNHEAKFQNILETQPLVCDLYDRAIRIINDSVFKDKITPSIWIDNKTYWMSLTMQDLIVADIKFVMAHYDEWRKLDRDLSIEKVTVA